MPEINRFYGITITMNFREHNPPHFHAIYQDYEISVDIKTGLVNGKMSKRALKMIFWMAGFAQRWIDARLEFSSREKSFT